MKREFPIKIRRCSIRGLVAIVLLILLSQVLASDPAPVPLRPRNAQVPEAHRERIARQIASGYGSGPFRPSLEMKENLDFLLTPAMLVQEASSEDIVVPYPTE